MLTSLSCQTTLIKSCTVMMSEANGVWRLVSLV